MAANPSCNHSVLFICTANQVRSPLAAALFSELIRRLNTPSDSWRIESAGTWAMEGYPIFPEVDDILQEKGIDFSSHRSRNITKDMLEQFALILVMEPGHKEALQAEFPKIAKRVYLLTEMIGENHPILDPIGGPPIEFKATAAEIEKSLVGGYPKIYSLSLEQ